jgi:hypothetical protein
MWLSRSTFVLQRRVNYDLMTVERALGLALMHDRAAAVAAECPQVTFEEPFAVVTAWPGHSWQARARLIDAYGRSVANIEVEFGIWSQHATELSLRPTSLHPDRWTPRRQTRYFDAAHRVCDELLQYTKRACERLVVPSAPPSVTTVVLS